MRPLLPGLGLLLGLALTSVASAEGPLEKGKSAPDMELLDHTAAKVTLEGLRGEGRLVVAFFPRAFTGG